MSNARIPIAVCAVVDEVLKGSHGSLEALFQMAGAPGPPPNLSHASKWKMWLAQASNDGNVDSLAVLGRVIEEFMDVPPKADPFSEDDVQWMKDGERLVNVLEWDACSGSWWVQRDFITRRLVTLAGRICQRIPQPRRGWGFKVGRIRRAEARRYIPGPLRGLEPVGWREGRRKIAAPLRGWDF